MYASAQSYFRRVADNFTLLSELCPAIDQAAAILTTALRGSQKIMFCGNGGSAADCQHLAAELMGRYLKERAPLPAVALTADTSALTAIGNDYGYEEVFARQVRALGAAGDVALGFSTSGRSPNVVRGLEAARAAGLATVAMTGAEPGPVGAAADRVIAIPSTDTPRVQEGQMIAAHAICEWVEARLATEDGAA